MTKKKKIVHWTKWNKPVFLGDELYGSVGDDRKGLLCFVIEHYLRLSIAGESNHVLENLHCIQSR